MVKADWRKREHQKIALEKLGDAVVLFKRKRYLASLYIVGYVFEMWTQYELKQLGERHLVDKTALAIVDQLSTEAITFYQANENLTQAIINNLWQQLSDLRIEIARRNLIKNKDSLYDFMTKITTTQQSNNNSQQKQLSTIIKKRPLFWAIVEGRLDSNTRGVDGHHDTVMLLETLEYWYSILGESKDMLAIREGFERLKWKVELRYEYTRDNTQTREYCKTARTAIELAYQWLTPIMGCKDAGLSNIQKIKC